MRTEFVEALREAESHDSPIERIDHIKRAVTKEIRAADPAASVRFTDYFNHIAVPDMVLRWPDEARERLLFVRPSANPLWLEDDLSSLTMHRPLIFTLQDLDTDHQARLDTDPPAGESMSELSQMASAANAWIAGPSAFEIVSNARKDSPVMGLLGQALVRGGRGVSTGQTVKALTMSTRNAFDDAAENNIEPVVSGVAALEANLDEQQAGRFTRILRAVWEGHGGSEAAFPAVASLGPLTDDDVTYLMTTLADASEEFWHRVGKNVTSSQLGRLRIDDPSVSLQRFMRANLDSLSAKALRVSSRQVGLGEDETFPRWLVDRGCLAIRGQDWIAHIAARKAEELPLIDEGKPLTLEEVRRGVGRGLRVTKVEFGKGDRAVSYESKERGSILEDDDLGRLERDVSGMLVEQATLALAGGGTMNVEFATRTAQGPTSSALPLGGLARAAVPLLVKLEHEEASKLEALLAVADLTSSGESVTEELPPSE